MIQHNQAALCITRWIPWGSIQWRQNQEIHVSPGDPPVDHQVKHRNGLAARAGSYLRGFLLCPAYPQGLRLHIPGIATLHQVFPLVTCRISGKILRPEKFFSDGGSGPRNRHQVIHQVITW